MRFEQRLSYPPSGPNLTVCENTYRAMVRVSQRWDFHYHGLEQLIRVVPSSDGWLLSESAGTLPYRLHGHEVDFSGCSHFGVVPFQREGEDFDVRRMLDFDISGTLPPARALNRTIRPKMARTCPVVLTLMGRDLLFDVPESELLDVVMRWTRDGHAK